MGLYYKCDLCGIPYAPTHPELMTAYIKIGNKGFNGRISSDLALDICPECREKILDFMDSLKPMEEKDE